MKRIRTILRALDPKAAATMSRRERTGSVPHPQKRRGLDSCIMRHRVMYVVQRACRAGQRGTERTCENGADRQFRNTFRKNGSIREIRKEIATIREENLGIVGNERRKGLSGGNGGTAGRRRHQSASRAVGRADGRSEKRNTCESAANGAKQRIWHGAISLLCGHQW